MKKIFMAMMAAAIVMGMVSCEPKGNDPEKKPSDNTPTTTEVTTTVWIPLLKSNNGVIDMKATLKVDGKVQTYDMTKDGKESTNADVKESILKSLSSSGIDQDDVIIYELPTVTSKDSCTLTLVYSIREGATIGEKINMLYGYRFVSKVGANPRKADNNIAASVGIKSESLAGQIERRNALYIDKDVR